MERCHTPEGPCAAEPGVPHTSGPLLLPLAPDMPFPPRLALPWDLANALDLLPSSLWGNSLSQVLFLEGKVPEGRALCSFLVVIPRSWKGARHTVVGLWSVVR